MPLVEGYDDMFFIFSSI